MKINRLYLTDTEIMLFIGDHVVHWTPNRQIILISVAIFVLQKALCTTYVDGLQGKILTDQYMRWLQLVGSI